MEHLAKGNEVNRLNEIAVCGLCFGRYIQYKFTMFELPFSMLHSQMTLMTFYLLAFIALQSEDCSVKGVKCGLCIFFGFM